MMEISVIHHSDCYEGNKTMGFDSAEIQRS